MFTQLKQLHHYLAIFFIVLCAFIILYSTLLALSQPIHAAPANSHTVTKTADSNDGVCDADCSLREAIAVANSGDTILFDDSLTSGGPNQITLLLGDILIAKSLTIIGPGADLLTIDGNNSSRILEISDSDDENTEAITISGLSFSNGNAGTDIGGAILAAESITLSQVVIQSSQAASGGGLVIQTFADSIATLDQTIIHSNVATRTSTLGVGNSAGGGILIYGANGGIVTIRNSEISQNLVYVRAPERAVALGGGLTLFAQAYQSDGATLTIINTKMIGNQIDASSPGSIGATGGAISAINDPGTDNSVTSPITIKDSTFLSNSIHISSDSASASANGGAISLASAFSGSSGSSAGNITISNSIIENNLITASVGKGLILYGGGIAVFNPGEANMGRDMTIINSTISGNHLTGTSSSRSIVVRGGGIHMLNHSFNSEDGGSLYLYGSTLSNNQISGTAVSATYPAWVGGGAIDLDNDEPIHTNDLGNLTHRGTQTVQSEANGGNAIISNSLFINNHVAGFAPNLTVEGGALRANLKGGESDLLAGQDGGSFHLFNSVISGSQVTAVSSMGAIARGSGLYINSRGGGVADGSSTNAGNGGAVTINRSTLTTNQIVLGGGNEIAFGVGGGIYIENSASIVQGSGTGSAGDGGDLSITNSTISQNSISTDGVDVTHADGGGLYVASSDTDDGDSGEVSIINSTVVQNRLVATATMRLPSHEGGGIYISNNSILLMNSIVAENSQPSDPMPDIFGNVSATTSLIGVFEDVMDPSSGNLVGTAVSPLDPQLGPLQFNGGDTPTHALLKNSPAIDAGSNVTCLAVDQRGEIRPFDGNSDNIAVCDMGAFEVRNTAVTLYLPLIYTPLD